MSKVFPPNSTDYLRLAGFVLTALLGLAVIGTWYYATPAYTRVGYEPTQPIRFSHPLHVRQLGLDCRYCHQHVAQSPNANVPHSRTCMNCHGEKWGNIKAGSPALAPLKEAWEQGRPVRWVRIHKVPDYAYFNHAVHIRRGVSCVSCHGKVNEMDVVRHHEPLSMSWCLDCHRAPLSHMRPADQVTNLDWVPESDARTKDGKRAEFERFLSEEVGVNPPQHCSGCHR